MTNQLIQTTDMNLTTILEDVLSEEQEQLIEESDCVWFLIKHGREVRYYRDAIPIKWVYKKLTEYALCDRCSSDGLKTVYDLIEDWRKENE